MAVNLPATGQASWLFTDVVHANLQILFVVWSKNSIYNYPWIGYTEDCEKSLFCSKIREHQHKTTWIWEHDMRGSQLTFAVIVVCSVVLPSSPQIFRDKRDCLQSSYSPYILTSSILYSTMEIGTVRVYRLFCKCATQCLWIEANFQPQQRSYHGHY